MKDDDIKIQKWHQRRDLVKRFLIASGRTPLRPLTSDTHHHSHSTFSPKVNYNTSEAMTRATTAMNIKDDKLNKFFTIRDTNQ